MGLYSDLMGLYSDLVACYSDLWDCILIQFHFIVIFWDLNGMYPLVTTHIASENHHAINGNGHGFNSYVSHYQRISVTVQKCHI